MLARAAAAEVATGKENLRALVARLVEHEVRVRSPARVVHPRLALIEITPGIEQVGAEARAIDRLQELLRDNGVGIDVAPVERRHQPRQDAKRLHQ
jgi:hypothetical protein